MINSDYYKNYLKQNLPVAKEASGGKEVYCKCRYCNDGKSSDHGHMYISIPRDIGDISVYYCQKCHSSGIVDNRTLIDWGIYSPEIAEYLLNKINTGDRNKVDRYKEKRYNTLNGVIDYELSESKISYLYQRLGIRFSEYQIIQSNIILNLKDILYINNINNFTRNYNIIEELNRYFIGFLSYDKNYINMRRIVGEGVVNNYIDKRYINYNIYNSKNTNGKFYILKCNIDVNTNLRIPVHIAEGPIDILSIKYNLDRDFGIFAAVTGSGYKGLIQNIMNSYRVYFIEIHIYPDNDIHGDDNIMIDLKRFLSLYNIPLYIHRNTYNGEKDFGVPKNRINEIIYEL